MTQEAYQRFSQLASLSEGSKIAIVAPAGRVKPGELDSSLSWLQSLGFSYQEGKHLYDDYFKGYHFAGNDAARKEDFQWAISDPDIDAIWCARGGYGSVKILEGLDLSPLYNKPKWICGYSDVTVLHHYLQTNGIPSIHGLTTKPLNTDYTARSYSHLAGAWKGERLNYNWETCALNQMGEAKAALCGGNLSMIYSMIGTDILVPARDKILFLEDWNENWYALDRMLMNLWKANYFEGVRAILLGSFTKMDVADENPDYNSSYDPTAYEILHELLSSLGVPIAFGFPAGHTGDNCPLIMGAEVALAVSDTASSLIFD